MIPIHLVLSNTITFIQVLKLLLDTLIILMAGTKFEFKIERYYIWSIVDNIV